MALPAVGDKLKICNPPTGDQTQIRTGICRFVGTAAFADGQWIGVELDAQYPGKHDGTVGGTRYFTCPSGQGIFVRPELVDLEARATAAAAPLAPSLSGSAGGLNSVQLMADMEELKDRIAEYEKNQEKLQTEIESALLDKEELQKHLDEANDEVLRLKAEMEALRVVAGGASPARAATIVPSAESISKIAQLESTRVKQDAEIKRLEHLVEEWKQRYESEVAAAEDNIGGIDIDALQTAKLEAQGEARRWEAAYKDLSAKTMEYVQTMHELQSAMHAQRAAEEHRHAEMGALIASHRADINETLTLLGLSSE